MRSFSGASLVVKAAVVLSVLSASGLALSGCAKVGQLKAMKSFKAANQAYQQQDYKKAAQLYEETVAADPNLASAYFYLGNSYDQQFKPSKKGEAENDALLTKAAENYKTAAEKLTQSEKPEEKKLAKLSLEYLVSVYGPDKLNDPANYFALAKIYEDAGAYDAAENILLKAKDAKPNDASVYTTLAGYYNRQGQFDKTIDALEQRAAKEPNNPEAFQTIATFYWDKAYRDATLKEPQKREYLQKGIEAVDQAIKIKPDYMEALVYKGLLLRLEANLEKDAKKQAELMKEANSLRDRAEELRKKKAAGVGE